MEVMEVHDQDMLVDLEKGNWSQTRVDSSGAEVNSLAGCARSDSWDDLVALKDDGCHHVSCCSSHCRDSIAKDGDYMMSEGEIKVDLSDNSVGDKKKKKRSKKPPRPPRPPSLSPLDPADQKLIDELSELAVLKRARIERMKALKKMKNSKPASSIGNLVALTITIIFCFFILWQGVFSGHGASISFHRPSISSAQTRSGLISIQFYKKNAAVSTHGSSSALNNTHVSTRLEIHGELTRVTE